MAKEFSIIYLARCTLKTEKCYIGKTHQETLEERIIQHEDSARKNDPSPFHQALLDFGLKNWEWTVLAECSIEDEYEKEKELIEKYRAAPIDLLNVTHNRKRRKKGKIISDKILAKTKGNRFTSSQKSEFGKLILRSAGKIKPVINLKTKKIYPSVARAVEKDNVSYTAISKSCKTGKKLADGTRYAYLDIGDNPIMTDGHFLDHSIRKKKKSRRIKNLINGKVYKDISEVVEEYGISSSCADGGARGTYMVIKQKWVFCYLDESGKEVITDKHRRGIEIIMNKNKYKYVAWHVDDESMTNIMCFKNLDEICDKLEISSKSHIKGVCDGNRHHVEKWRIAYYDHETQSPVLTPKHKETPKKVIRRIICLNDSREFENGSEAGKHYKIISSQVTKCAKGESKSVYCKGERLRFAFLDDNGKPVLKPKHKETLSARGKSRIQVIRTGEIYNSFAEYLRETGVPYKTAKRYQKDNSVELFGFEFMEID